MLSTKILLPKSLLQSEANVKILQESEPWKLIHLQWGNIVVIYDIQYIGKICIKPSRIQKILHYKIQIFTKYPPEVTSSKMFVSGAEGMGFKSRAD